jgi:hypothetical protein
VVPLRPLLALNPPQNKLLKLLLVLPLLLVLLPPPLPVLPPLLVLKY